MKVVDGFRVLFARLCMYEAEDAASLGERIYKSDMASRALKDAGISLPARHKALQSFKRNRIKTVRFPEKKVEFNRPAPQKVRRSA